MSKSKEFVSTRAFAEKAGVSAGTVSKWLRSGKIVGKKENGKWRISTGQLAKLSSPAKPPAKRRSESRPAKAAKAAVPKTVGSAYSVEAFSEMTYLTEFGVKLWLKTGRLVSSVDSEGRTGVDAASLDLPHVKRLVR